MKTGSDKGKGKKVHVNFLIAAMLH